MTDVVLLPSARKRSKGIGPRDVRRIGFPDSPNTHMPPARTRPGERWHLNGYNLTQVVVVREPDEEMTNPNPYHIPIGNFETVRDAACAMQGHNAFNLICDAFEISRTPESFYNYVEEVLKAFGRKKA